MKRTGNIRKVKDQYLVRMVIEYNFEMEGSLHDILVKLNLIQANYLNVVVEYNDYDYLNFCKISGDRLASDDEIIAYEAKLSKTREADKKLKKKEREERSARKKKEDKAALVRVQKAYPELLRDEAIEIISVT
jgi:hypothetical protein